jgi:hypothetical protein
MSDNNLLVSQLEQALEKRFGKHPTQKPGSLLKRIVLASTNAGDLIVDPFAGSSTTGLVAYYFGRDFVGIDNEQKYLDLSIKRFESLSQKMEQQQKLMPSPGMRIAEEKADYVICPIDIENMFDNDDSPRISKRKKRAVDS